ncbi:MAG: hypothetical protein B6230_03790 [Desulfobacteraceae bacterium 4572_89]|nr:MAG: hypothetical protein B6230_03790 [Desulfobacteraceae bacterium 4572_89]
MKKIKLALLSGGISSEREVSLNSGDQVFDALDKDRYQITRYDPKTDLPQLVLDAAHIDAALIILHGPFGEDGTVQGLLDLLDIPYQGAGILGSAVAMNKLIAKRLYDGAGVPTPAYLSFSINHEIKIQEVINTLDLPLVVKPACAGSSVGMTIVKAQHDLEAAIALGFEHDDTLVIEKYIKGTEGELSVLETNTIPGMTATSLFPQSAQVGGYSFSALLDKLIQLAIEENKKLNLRRAK